MTVLAHLLHLVVHAGVVDAVGGDELRRDPARAHRLEHVRVVVRDEVVHHLAVDRDRVVEALVALDELLDGDRSAVVDAGGTRSPRPARSASSARCVPDAPAASRGLRITGKPTCGGERLDLGRPTTRRSRPRRARRPPAAPPSSPACRGRGTRCATDVPGIVHASRTCAAAMMWASTVASRRSTQTRVLDPAHGVEQGALVDDGVHLLVVQPWRAFSSSSSQSTGRSPMPITRRADLGQGAHELPLVGREGRLEEDDVHGRS